MRSDFSLKKEEARTGGRDGKMLRDHKYSIGRMAILILIIIQSGNNSVAGGVGNLLIANVEAHRP